MKCLCLTDKCAPYHLSICGGTKKNFRHRRNLPQLYLLVTLYSSDLKSIGHSVHMIHFAMTNREVRYAKSEP